MEVEGKSFPGPLLQAVLCCIGHDTDWGQSVQVSDLEGGRVWICCVLTDTATEVDRIDRRLALGEQQTLLVDADFGEDAIRRGVMPILQVADLLLDG